MPTHPKVVIVLLNYNGWKDTLECLESVKALAYPNFETVVVDNASTDSSWEELQGWTKRMSNAETENHQSSIVNRQFKVTLLQSGANRGYAGGNNVGIRYALAGATASGPFDSAQGHGEQSRIHGGPAVPPSSASGGLAGAPGQRAAAGAAPLNILEELARRGWDEGQFIQILAGHSLWDEAIEEVEWLISMDRPLGDMLNALRAQKELEKSRK